MCSEEATDEVADALKSGAPEANSNTQSTTADPVNLVTGAFVLTETDVKIPVGRLMLEFTRHYDSSQHKATGDSGPIGRGWTHSYHLFLTLDDPKHPVYHDDRMTNIRFEPDPERKKTFIPVGRCGVELYRRKEGFHLRQGDGLRAEFTDGGMLTRIVRPGPKLDVTIELEYDTRRRLQRVRGLGGRELRFRYEGESPLICQLSDHTGRGWHFAYVRDELACITRPDHALCEYEYARSDMHVATARKQTAKKTVCGMVKVFLPRLADDERVAMATNRYTSEGRVYEQFDALGHVTSFDYNLYTRTTCVTDPEGWTTVYCFDEAGNTTKMRKPGGGTREWFFDENRNLVAEIDECGYRTEYVEFCNATLLDKSLSYCQRVFGNRSVVFAVHSADIAVGYDAWGNRPVARNKMGQTTFYRMYNQFGVPEQLVFHDQASMSFACDPRSGQPLEKRFTTASGETLVVQWTYDEFGNTIRREQWRTTTNQPSPEFKRIEEWGYDDFHHLVIKSKWISHPNCSDPLKSRRLFTFDSTGFCTSVTNIVVATGSTDTEITAYFGRDELGRKFWSIDSAGSGTVMHRGIAGQVLMHLRVANVTPVDILDATTCRGHRIEVRSFDICGRRIVSRDPLGAETRWQHDSCGRETVKTYPLGCMRTRLYDRDGHLVADTTPAGLETYLSYDSAGRITAIRDSEGANRTLQYDGIGRVVLICDAGAAEPTVTRFTYDCHSQLLSATRSDDTCEQFRYDVEGNLFTKQVVGSEGTVVRRTEMEFDSVGRTISINDGVGEEKSQITYNVFSPDGTTITTTDGDGLSTITTVDSEGRAICRQFPDGTKLRFSYTCKGKLARRWSDSNAVDGSFRYDDLGHLVETCEGKTIHRWQYDNRGLVIGHTQIVGDESCRIVYVYDAGKRLVSTQIDDIDAITIEYRDKYPLATAVVVHGEKATLEYDGRANLTAENWDCGTRSEWSYGPDGLITECSMAKPGGPAFHAQCTRDSRGRPIHEEVMLDDQALAFEYEYDAANQLIKVVRNGETVSSVFDSRSNRRAVLAEGSKSSSIDFTAGNRISRMLIDGNNANVSFDCHGNMSASGNRMFEHDEAGRLRLVCKETEHVKFEYSATGELVRIDGADCSETLFYDGPHIAVRRAGSKSTFYSWRTVIDSLRGIRSSGERFRPSATDLRGSVISSEDSIRFLNSQVFFDGESAESGFAFGGKFFERTSGLLWSRMRWLDLSLGRFVEPDPAGFLDGPNLYTFGRNNPTTFSDPTGLVAINAPFAFSQSSVSNFFSAAGDFGPGVDNFSPGEVGMSIFALSQAIVANLISPSEIEVQYVTTEQNNLFVNNRSALALMAADVPIDQWNKVDVTNERTGFDPSSPDKTYAEYIADRLAKNNLDSRGTPFVEVTGWR